jgi:hypothetical protein
MHLRNIASRIADVEAPLEVLLRTGQAAVGVQIYTVESRTCDPRPRPVDRMTVIYTWSSTSSSKCKRTLHTSTLSSAEAPRRCVHRGDLASNSLIRFDKLHTLPHTTRTRRDGEEGDKVLRSEGGTGARSL